MKKMKMVLLTVAIITAVTGAFAAKKKFNCFDFQQYYKISEGNYWPTGQYAVNYYCTVSPSITCTYILTSSGYEPCRLGNYSVPMRATEGQPAK